ncbi:ActS/PrrB/RegB family redox-sensitive histidine kinase [Pinisolibacter aquiterrae]|uniref:ActS/PrrB/RegB family redox-sensitive histidine kinase n=1 Tax=Pinisolibacter aquiterrae TaxID=2815579 RepID=UPI001C3DAFA9|nr:ActS/PrrB/RegB family redox-sensitive histidine kinase [Pinisolibacter aquiterrae]MBV5265507.1 ActS/PrrB/RegB family redox-sensitive histidine kinase [Pinisolibacter aquiterrae]MCC8236926.1 ActS/PrrB/RegB family redox-sensitive histidine kinase [Pinisolibacter aquiterrae]
MLGVLADFGDTSVRSLKLDTLVRLRWLAVAGQTAAVLFVRFGLGFHLPLMECFALIGASMALNILLRLRFSSIHRLDGIHATLLLGWDALQLTGLLWLTGGLENPFACLLLAPVLVSSASLPPRSTALLGVVVAVATTVLAAFHAPLPWGTASPPSLPVLYVVGIWLALILTLSFSALYAFRVADESRRLAEALTATELVLQRERHLVALDGLAAAAAHELGTPLGTIAVVAREMERELPAGSPLAEDVALLRSQTERCRDILRKLSSMGEDPDAFFARQSLVGVIEEVVEPFRDLGTDLEVRRIGEGGEPIGRRNPAILYGLGNIVENAVDFAETRVTITIDWNDREVTVVVGDDGPGFSSSVLERLGEPWVTTREPLGPDEGGREGAGGGLGLGFFIAQTFLMRSGARVTCDNKHFPEHGAEIRIQWPRSFWRAEDEPIGSSNFPSGEFGAFGAD